MGQIKTVGLVLHPQRDSAEAVETVGRVRPVEQNGHQLADRAGVVEARGQRVEQGGGGRGLGAELVEPLRQRDGRHQRRLRVLGGVAEVDQRGASGAGAHASL